MNEDPKFGHLVMMTKEIGHYHHERARSVSNAVSKLTVVPVMEELLFPQFEAPPDQSYDVVPLFGTESLFAEAVAAGCLRRRVVEVLDRLAPDGLALSGWAGPEISSAIAWCRDRGVPSVLMSESQAHDAIRSPFRELVKSRLVRLCGAALVGGPSHKDYLVRLGMPVEAIELGYNAVGNDHYIKGADAARAAPAALRFVHNLPERFILASGRFIPKKNFAKLIYAYAEARMVVPSAPDLVIIGDGALRPQLEAARAASGMNDFVHLPGFKGYEELPVIYGLAEGFVHIPAVEQWGLVINEAMASGLPVIVSKKCGAATLVQDGRSGWLVDPEDHYETVQALIWMLQISPCERERMGRCAKEYISDWGPERFVKGLNYALKRAQQGRNRGIAPWDRSLLTRMERRIIRDVS